MIKVKVNNEVKEITRILYYEKVGGILVERSINLITEGARVIWQGIRSCFGGGDWINDKPWLKEDVWK